MISRLQPFCSSALASTRVSTLAQTLVLIAALLAAFITTPVLAQTYPTRPVKIIVPFAAGGPADNFARFMGQRLQDALGQSFVVDNRPGGGSVIGTDAAAKADRKSTRLNSSHPRLSRMPSSA